MSTTTTRRKILSRAALVRRSREMTAAGRRLVLTNGCFDLLHAGHVRYLEEAAVLGDALAVGVNSDASTRRLKGPDRPLVPQHERAEVVAALEAVSYVVIFTEDTAAELVTAVQPAIYVKGGDYATNPEDAAFPPEGHIVLGYGGQVRTVDYLANHSTSAMLARLRAAHE